MDMSATHLIFVLRWEGERYKEKEIRGVWGNVGGMRDKEKGGIRCIRGIWAGWGMGYK